MPGYLFLYFAFLVHVESFNTENFLKGMNVKHERDKRDTCEIIMQRKLHLTLIHQLY